jgi:flagellar export protein FliJ
MVLIQGGAVETTIEELKNRRDYMEFLINEIHKQERVIKAKENEVERARQVLIEVSMERRTFEKLDEKRKEAIEKEFLRKEQIVSDEHGTTGFSRGRL